MRDSEGVAGWKGTRAAVGEAGEEGGECVPGEGWGGGKEGDAEGEVLGGGVDVR